MSDRFAFALCLTHDVDRPYKTYQGLYEAVRTGSRERLASVLPGRNPYWQFEEIATLERRLGVRSAFYFLSEPSLLAREPSAWVSPANWIEHAGRYDVTATALADVIRRLDADGWEVGLHGSRDAATDRDRLAHEKEQLEAILGHPVSGGRHHHLALDRPATWQNHSDVGLSYDSSLGSTTSFGFQHGYEPLSPFGDEFTVFPLTLMDQTLPSPGTAPDEAWAACEDLLREAADNEAVMTVLWHPRYFNAQEFPGYRRLYRRLVDRALEMDAWVGPPGRLHEQLVESAADRATWSGLPPLRT